MGVGIRRWTAGLVAVLVVSSLGCRRRLAGSPSTDLRVAMAREVHGLDPHRQTAHGGLSVVSNVYESLTAFDEEMRVVPALAVRWESPDELTWRFHLRPRVSFHDGRPLTPAAVVKSLARARLPGRSPEGGLASIEEVTVPAPDMVQIRTARPSLMLLNDLATAFIVPEDAPPEITSPVGTGPYRFVSFQPQAGLELAAWEGYWNGRPPVSRLFFVFEPDPERRQEMVASGAVDVALRLSDTARERAGAGYHVVWRAAPGTRVLGLRVDRPPFSDFRVRRAVSLAIDREGFARTFLAGRGLAVGQFLPRGIFGYVPDILAPSRDVAEARRLLQAAAPRGLTVTLDHGQGRQSEAEAVAAHLADAGFRVTLHSREVPDLVASLDSAEAKMVLFSYIFSTGDANVFFASMLHSRDAGRGYGTKNAFGYRNPEVDALIEAAETSSPTQERLAKYQGALRLATADLPAVPLWEVPWVYGVRDDVQWNPVAHGWFDAVHARRR